MWNWRPYSWQGSLDKSDVWCSQAKMTLVILITVRMALSGGLKMLQSELITTACHKVEHANLITSCCNILFLIQLLPVPSLSFYYKDTLSSFSLQGFCTCPFFWLKYSTSKYFHGCLLLIIKTWGQMLALQRGLLWAPLINATWCFPVSLRPPFPC